MKQKTTLVIMRGLPGSGKSTKAQWLVREKPGQYMRINRDELRAMSGEQSRKIVEKYATRMRDSLIITALENGITPVIDDTNMDLSAKKRHFQDLIIKWDTSLQNSISNFNDKYEFEVIDLTHVSVEECIKRDAERALNPTPGRSVGEKVIRGMYKEHLMPQPKQVEYSPTKEDVIVSDLDGTVALITDRSPYSQNEYYKDVPNLNVIKTLRTLSTAYKIIIVSGRQGTPEVLKQTQDWLAANNVPYNEIYTRAADDPHRQDALVKLEILQEKLLPKYNIVMIFDDRNRVVQMWREQGLTCSQVNQGDF